jgi:TatD DNase family protein
MLEHADKQTLSLIDTHAHLDMEHFDADREAVIERAFRAGVTGIITVGIDLATSRRAVALAESHPGIRAAVGIHPQEAGKYRPDDIQTLAGLAASPVVAAIGEIGLDFFRDYAPHAAQLTLLEKQLELASRLALPVVIHCRSAENELLPLLTAWTGKCGLASPGVIHCFSGNLETAEKYLSLGFYISLGGYIGYPSSKELRKVIRGLPLDRLLVETDCPFLPPQSRRGQRNEPAYIVETAGVLAEIKGLELAETAAGTTANAVRLFKLEIKG